MTTGTWLIASVVAAVTASPLLASWSDALAGGRRAGWWRPRAVGLPRVWLLVVVTGTAALATPGDPVLAWWLLATGGAVLAAVDAQTLLLPARLVYAGRRCRVRASGGRDDR